MLSVLRCWVVHNRSRDIKLLLGFRLNRPEGVALPTADGEDEDQNDERGPGTENGFKDVISHTRTFGTIREVKYELDIVCKIVRAAEEKKNTNSKVDLGILGGANQSSARYAFEVMRRDM